MKQLYLISISWLLSSAALSFCSAQQNITVTEPEAYNLLTNNYGLNDYLPGTLINHPEDIAAGLIDAVSPDSLKSYLFALSSFGNRNTGSDTSSTTFGMGAARRWAFAKFEEFSAAAEGRLAVSYLQFDQNVCGMGQHRNTFAVLPGIGPNRNELIIVEGHMDSRCEDECDTECLAEGMEDNGSGTALVLELARVMSHYAFDRTLVFLITTGEEQGLIGADAFATFCSDEGIPVRAVYNNDIVGGVICGATASPPGCPGLNNIDSINVRIYSSTSTRHLARFARLEYEEAILPNVAVPSVINIMSREDRVGRGGDHIPFRQEGIAAIRFTSANEHGDGNPSAPGYEDRQHSMEDILGVDTDGDNVIDSFFVDFNYLARNAVINGNAMAMSALGPKSPTGFSLQDDDNGFAFEVEDPNDYGLYRIAIRQFGSGTNYFDTLITVTEKTGVLSGLIPSTPYYVTSCTVDSNGVESHFSEELFDFFITDVEDFLPENKGITLLQNRPNPFDEATTIGINVEGMVSYSKAELRVSDNAGKLLARYPVELKPGLTEIVYGYEKHGYRQGIYYYSLVIDGEVYDTKAMVYAY